MTDPKSKAEDAAAKPDTETAAPAGGPMDFLMVNMQDLLSKGITDAELRTDEEIESDFDNMPI